MDRGTFWRYYFMAGIITIPLTIVFGSVLLAFFITSIGLMIGGPAAIIYSVAVGIMAASPLLFFTYCGAALIVLGTGLLMLWVTKQLFRPFRAVFAGRRSL